LLEAAQSVQTGYPFYWHSQYHEAVGGAGIFIRDPDCTVIGSVSSERVEPVLQTYSGIARIGGTVTVGVASEPGRLTLLAASYRPMRPLPTPFGSAWVDPGSVVFLGLGPASQTGVYERRLSIMSGVPLGAQVVAQGALLPNGGASELAAASVTVVLPPVQ
jgi:hypothetical protein